MVTFALAKRSDRELIYYYYPEGNEAKTPGKIRVNLQNKKIEVIRKSRLQLKIILFRNGGISENRIRQ